MIKDQWLYKNFVRTKGRRSPTCENLVRAKYSGFTVCVRWHFVNNSTFTYYRYRALKIEKLLEIFFFGQIGRNQEAKAGKCDTDSFCLAHLRGKFLAQTWRHLGAIIFASFGRDTVRVAWEVSLACPSRAWQKACQHFWHAVWQCVEGRRAAGNYSWLGKGRNRQWFLRQVIRPFQREKWTKLSCDIFLLSHS